MKSVETPFKEFLENYKSRHCNPINLTLHIIGIPLTVIGCISFLNFKFFQAITQLFIGFALQYIGHKIQKSEMGEIILIKKLFNLENKKNG